MRFETPQVPNFFSLKNNKGHSEPIPIGKASPEEIDQIIEFWSKELKKKFEDQRDDCEGNN